jgi:hypothetical protein
MAYRIWRLYMAGSAHSFQTGRLNLYQVLLITSNKTFIFSATGVSGQHILFSGGLSNGGRTLA